MHIVHTYIKNMGIQRDDETLFTFADRWGLVSQAALGHEVTLLCGGSGKKRVTYVWKGIKIIELPVFFQFSSSSRFLKGLLKELRSIDADVFHAHHYCSFIPELTALIGRQRNIPTFLTVHSSFTGQSGILGLLERFYGVLMQPFLPLFTKVLFISYFIKDSKFFSILPERKKGIVYNHFLQPLVKKEKKQPHTMLFIGRVTYLKGLDILLKAVALVKKDIPDVHLDVVGDGPQSYKHKLQKILKEYSLEKQVTFHGAVYDDRKWEFFAKNMIQVIPSRGEGFGNVVIEGMLCGLPVVVSNRGALAEAGGGHAIVAALTPEDLAAKICNLLNDEALRKTRSDTGKLYAQRFTKHTIGKEMITLYEEAQ